MAVTLTLTGKTPGQTQFGLDTFTEHYKCDATADVVLTDGSVPAMGSAHPDYSTMFVTARYCSETGESASALDLTYTGTFGGTLPPSQANTSNQIQVTQMTYLDVMSGMQTLVLQFYSTVSTLSWVSYGAPGTVGSATDPDDPTPRYLTVTDVLGQQYTFDVSSGDWTTYLSTYFSLLISDVIQTQEIVAGQYWLNTETKTSYYSPIVTP